MALPERDRESTGPVEFSRRTRARAWERFESETFDFLVIGGGITGAGVARDAASRGFRVALVEKRDFAWGTSSRSSKLVHGGLRYLQNFEFGLVFEALAERALLLKTVPHMVRPLRFFFPVYQGDPNGRLMLGLGLWLYDLLALFRTPGFHRGLSRKRMLEKLPFLRSEGLQGGFEYSDASMWDDVLAVETLRSAQARGAVIANYVEAMEPIFESGGEQCANSSSASERLRGFIVRDVESGKTCRLRAAKVIVCAGPWTDVVGKTISPKWHAWLKPSKGVHLIFDHKRLPVPGAMVMSQPEDGRISFVIPRPDYGAGVVIVGTTDGPTPELPENAAIEGADVRYLLELLGRYFPTLKLGVSDILSAYVGVRPLFGSQAGTEGQDETTPQVVKLQKVSREHHIDHGPGRSVVVAGGKYTTYRKMAEEIVEFAIRSWKHELAALRLAGKSELPALPKYGSSSTRAPLNPQATGPARKLAEKYAKTRGILVPPELFDRYGAEALKIVEIAAQHPGPAGGSDPDGFPLLDAQLRHAIRAGMVVHLEDFYLRRAPLFAARADHGLPWAERLAAVWAEESGMLPAEANTELERLRAEVAAREAWKSKL